jgi:hypothetical protein
MRFYRLIKYNFADFLCYIHVLTIYHLIYGREVKPQKSNLVVQIK